MMKIIHTGDWHIGKALNHFSLLEDQAYYLDKLLQLTKEEKADVLIIAGDLYDRSVPPAEAVSLMDQVLCRFVQDAKVKVLAISGNHDSAQRLSFANQLYKQSGLYLVSTYEGEIQQVVLEDKYGEIAFYLLPYVTPLQVKAILGEENIKTSNDAISSIMQRESIPMQRRNVMIAHGFFAGSGTQLQLSESETSVGGSDMCSCASFQDFDYTALGHIHKSQRAAGENIRYCGSLLKYSVSEACQEKSVTVINIKEKGNMEFYQRQITPLRDLRIVRGSIEELLQPGYVENTDDYIFAEITNDGMVLDAMSRLRSVYKNVLGLKMLNRERELSAYNSAGEKLKNKSVYDLFCDFYTDIKGEPIPANRAEVIKETIQAAEEANI